MPEPSAGQPFVAYGGARVSVGDLGANYGTEAGMGVVILELGMPADYIISPPAPFTAQAQVRTALGGAPYVLPVTLVTNFHIVELLTGAAVAGSPFLGAAPVPIPTPAGDHGTDGPWDSVTWYAIDSPAIPILPAGIYRITVVGHDGAVLFVHDDTVILVG